MGDYIVQIDTLYYLTSITWKINELTSEAIVVPFFSIFKGSDFLWNIKLVVVCKNTKYMRQTVMKATIGVYVYCFGLACASCWNMAYLVTKMDECRWETYNVKNKRT